MCSKLILDACCGSRMFWFNKTNPLTTFMDIRDEVLKKEIICLDDIGVETPIVIFGNKKSVFGEIIDAAEKEGKLIIATSNLNKNDLIAKYGDRGFERIVSTCLRVPFTNKSLRK